MQAVSKSDVKAFGFTGEVHRKLDNLSAEEGSGTPCVAVECVEYMEEAPVAKAATWSATDAETRKHG